MTETDRDETHRAMNDRDFLLRVPDALLTNVSSTKTIGKLMTLWLFLRKKIYTKDFMVNDDLELVLSNGNVVQGSNLIDLLHYVILRSSKRPIGYREFRQMMQGLRVPKHLTRRLRDKSDKNAKGLYRKARLGAPGHRNKFKNLESL